MTTESNRASPRRDATATNNSATYQSQDSQDSEPDTPLLPGVLLALRNRPNLLLLPVWLLANVAVYTAMAVLPFWVQYVLRPPDGQRELWFLAVCGATYGAALVAIPFWSYVAEHPRSSKKQATLVSWACSLVIAGLLLLLGEGQFVAEQQ